MVTIVIQMPSRVCALPGPRYGIMSGTEPAPTPLNCAVYTPGAPISPVLALLLKSTLDSSPTRMEPSDTMTNGGRRTSTA